MVVGRAGGEPAASVFQQPSKTHPLTSVWTPSSPVAELAMCALMPPDLAMCALMPPDLTACMHSLLNYILVLCLNSVSTF